MTEHRLPEPDPSDDKLDDELVRRLRSLKPGETPPEVRERAWKAFKEREDVDLEDSREADPSAPDRPRSSGERYEFSRRPVATRLGLAHAMSIRGVTRLA